MDQTSWYRGAADEIRGLRTPLPRGHDTRPGVSGVFSTGVFLGPSESTPIEPQKRVHGPSTDRRIQLFFRRFHRIARRSFVSPRCISPGREEIHQPALPAGVSAISPSSCGEIHLSENRHEPTVIEESRRSRGWTRRHSVRHEGHSRVAASKPHGAGVGLLLAAHFSDREADGGRRFFATTITKSANDGSTPRTAPQQDGLRTP